MPIGSVDRCLEFVRNSAAIIRTTNTTNMMTTIAQLRERGAFAGSYVGCTGMITHTVFRCSHHCFERESSGCRLAAEQTRCHRSIVRTRLLSTTRRPSSTTRMPNLCSPSETLASLPLRAMAPTNKSIIEAGIERVRGRFSRSSGSSPVQRVLNPGQESCAHEPTAPLCQAHSRCGDARTSPASRRPNLPSGEMLMPSLPHWSPMRRSDPQSGSDAGTRAGRHHADCFAHHQPRSHRRRERIRSESIDDE